MSDAAFSGSSAPCYACGHGSHDSQWGLAAGIDGEKGPVARRHARSGASFADARHSVLARCRHVVRRAFVARRIVMVSRRERISQVRPLDRFTGIPAAGRSGSGAENGSDNFRPRMFRAGVLAQETQELVFDAAAKTGRSNGRPPAAGEKAGEATRESRRNARPLHDRIESRSRTRPAGACRAVRPRGGFGPGVYSGAWIMCARPVSARTG
jgi:hypothetical protein